jgi:ribonuclease inhibitor
MKQIIFDFAEIKTKKDFYKQFKNKLELQDDFGNNLDALYDVLTGEIELPVELIFENVDLEKLEKFESIFETIEDAENELSEELSFRYFVGKAEL